MGLIRVEPADTQKPPLSSASLSPSTNLPGDAGSGN
jgi:hypothetical protein